MQSMSDIAFWIGFISGINVKTADYWLVLN